MVAIGVLQKMDSLAGLGRSVEDDPKPPQQRWESLGIVSLGTFLL